MIGPQQAMTETKYDRRLDLIKAGTWDVRDEQGKWIGAVALPTGWYVDLKTGGLKQAQ